jgi:hypothetical protein
MVIAQSERYVCVLEKVADIEKKEMLYMCGWEDEMYAERERINRSKISKG